MQTAENNLNTNVNMSNPKQPCMKFGEEKYQQSEHSHAKDTVLHGARGGARQGRCEVRGAPVARRTSGKMQHYNYTRRLKPRTDHHATQRHKYARPCTQTFNESNGGLM